MPIALFVALSVQLACQLFKFLVYSFRDRRISPRYLVTAGGMPSAHSAFVSALSMYVGLSEGFGGAWFSVSMVFALIVMYDAFRLRGHVQTHALQINRIIDRMEAGSAGGPDGNAGTGREDGDLDKVSEMVGHSLMEVASGLLIGLLWALCCHYLLVPALFPATPSGPF